jgi:hypothetical protein
VAEQCGQDGGGASDRGILKRYEITPYRPLPAVVYLGTDPDGTVTFFEPAAGKQMTAPREKVERNWSGEAVVFENPAPPPAFVLSVAAATAVGVVLVGVIGWRRVR